MMDDDVCAEDTTPAPVAATPAPETPGTGPPTGP